MFIILCIRIYKHLKVLKIVTYSDLKKYENTIVNLKSGRLNTITLSTHQFRIKKLNEKGLIIVLTHLKKHKTCRLKGEVNE